MVKFVFIIVLMSAEQQKIVIRLESFDARLLDRAIRDIIDSVMPTGTRIRGPIPLPTDQQKFTVNRSPHVDKKSREQFQLSNHKRLLVLELRKQTLAVLKQLDLPAGVSASIKLNSFADSGIVEDAV